MTFDTVYFGQVDVPDDRVIRFAGGIPAFPSETSFVIIHDEENPDSLFLWLQSTQTPELVFTIMDTLSVLPDYAPLVAEEELATIKMGADSEDDFFIYNIANMPESGQLEALTINLKGPILINQKTGQGKQVISDSNDHHLRYLVYQDIKNRKS